jgi:methylmalonyl-CoA/ethylmalonyl-CoA epimerase
LLDLDFHHVGVLVKDIAKARSHYARLGYLPATEVFNDHVQTALVQFLKLPGICPYLELVAPDGAESKLAGALRKGGGLHHVCYSTADIEGTCKDLWTAGWFLVAPPVGAVAFGGRRIAWLMGPDRLLMELVEKGGAGEL